MNVCGMRPECQRTDINGHGLCDMHYKRWVRYGDPFYTHEPRKHTTDTATYETVHDWLRYAKGSASRHLCVDCGGQAVHWSYDHNDPNEKFDKARRCPYSTDLTFYVPRCGSCHSAFDGHFSVEDILKIRELWASGTITGRAIAKLYGVSPPCISLIVTRKSYKHL